MGIFGNSFKRELGKNTAKRVSNALFGDKWATPYKRINSNSGSKSPSAAQIAHDERQKEKIELRRRKLELAESRHNVNEGLKRAEAQRLRDQQMWELDSAVIKNVDAVIAIKIPEDETNLEALTLRLSNQLATEHWCEINRFGNKDKEGSIRDKYVDALFSKYCMCFSILSDRYPSNPSIPYLNEQKFYNEQKKRKAQIWPLGIENNLITTIEIPNSDILIEKLLDELKPYYKYAYHKNAQNKYLEALSSLEKLNPDSPKLSSYYKYHKKILWNHRWNKYKKVWSWLIGIYAILFIIGLMCIFLGVPQQQTFGKYLISILSIFLLFILMYPISLWYIRKRKLDSYRKNLLD